MDARLLSCCSLAVATVLLASPAAAQEAEPRPRPQHVGLQLSVFDNSVDVLGFGGLSLDVGTNTFYGAVNYWYSGSGLHLDAKSVRLSVGVSWWP